MCEDERKEIRKDWLEVSRKKCQGKTEGSSNKNMKPTRKKVKVWQGGAGGNESKDSERGGKGDIAHHFGKEKDGDGGG